MLTGSLRHSPRHTRSAATRRTATSRTATSRTAPRRRPLAVTLPGLALGIATLAALAGCSGTSSSSAPVAEPSAVSAPNLPAPASASAPAVGFGAANASGTAGAAQADSATPLITDDQQLIYTAQLTVRAANVDTALSRATSIVTAAGGYVSASTNNGGTGQPATANAVVTLKIPAAAYQATLGKLTGTGLGTQLDLSQQAQDVTQQVADVSSRVGSDEAAIVALRALLKHAGNVGGLLNVQEQINSQESDLEAMLAQQQALNHETSFATVTLTILGPKAAAKAKHKPVPPPGLAGGLAGGWRAFRLTVDWLLAIIGAVAPFAAVVVVIGGGVWWVRRRLARGAGGGAGAAPSTD